VERGHGSYRKEAKRVTVQTDNKTGVRRATTQQKMSQSTTARSLKGRTYHSRESRAEPPQQNLKGRATTARSQGRITKTSRPKHHSK